MGTERPNVSLAVRREDIRLRAKQATGYLADWQRQLLNVGVGLVLGLSATRVWPNVQGAGQVVLAAGVAVGTVLSLVVAEWLYRLAHAEREILRERLGNANARIRELESTLEGVQRPRIRVEIVKEVGGSEIPHQRPHLWGLKITNDGAAAVFEATVKLVSGAASAGDDQRAHRLFFSRAKTTRARIIPGSEDRVFFALAWWMPRRYNYGLVGKDLWYFDEVGRRETSVPLVSRFVVPGGGGLNPIIAKLEVAIISDPPMMGPWVRRYRFGPGDELIELPSSGRT